MAYLDAGGISANTTDALTNVFALASSTPSHLMAMLSESIAASQVHRPSCSKMSTVALPIVVSILTGVMLIVGSRFTNLLYRFIVGDAEVAAPNALDGKPSGVGGQPGVDEAELAELRKRRDAAMQEVSRLRYGAWAAFVLMSIEVVGGILTNSMALVAESLHLFSDASSFIMSAWAIELMTMKATSQFSYGLQQAGVLGTLLSMLIIWVMAGVLAVEATSRVLHPEPVNGPLMTLIASLGLLSNLLLMATLGHQHADIMSLLSDEARASGSCCCGTPGDASSAPVSRHPSQAAASSSAVTAAAGPQAERGLSLPRSRSSTPSGRQKAKFCDSFTPREHDDVGSATQEGMSLVMKAALVHVIGDILQSIGAVIAGVLIWWEPFSLGRTRDGFSRWCYIDSSITLIYICLVVLTTRSTIKEVLLRLLLACPRGLDLAAFAEQLRAVPGVERARDVHVWQIGQSKVCTAHLLTSDPMDCQDVLNACVRLSQKYKIDHSTFQVEGVN
mmetsp:Transcript_103502/g.259466  ORF Transcript_103502/g.259466 Transcript_103502/m.259466 type:complete len:504 (-) Transcript_103502:97-1608(-)